VGGDGGLQVPGVSSARSVREREAVKRYLEELETRDAQEEVVIDPRGVASVLEKLRQHPEPEARFSVYQGHLTLNLNTRQSTQPRDPLFSKHGTCNRCHLTDHRPKRRRRRRLARKFLKRLGPEKHFISVAHDTLPAEIANAIDNLYGTRTAVCEITAVENQVRRGLLQIRQDCLERRSIPMNIG
jgi:hypothetical protein